MASKRYKSLRERLNANSMPERIVKYDPTKPWSAVPCRIWTGARSGNSQYGKITIRSRKRWKFGPKKGQRIIRFLGAHRVSLAEHLGIPVYRLNHVSHQCDQRLCIEPEHLRSWTASKNMQDMIAKGRGRNQFGALRKAA